MTTNRRLTGARARALLAGVLGLGFLAIGCGGSSASSSFDAGPRDAKADAADVAAACRVALLPQSPASFDGLVADPAAKLRVRGQVTGLPAASYTWSWSVVLADGSPVDFAQPIATDPGLIEFSLAAAGSYTVAASLVGSPTFCGGEQTVLVKAAAAKLASFRFHVTPPSGSDPVQEQEIQIVGGTPTGGNKIALSAGTLVPLQLRDAGGKSLAGYLSVKDAASRVVAEVRVGSDGAPAPLRLPAGTYDVLVVPDGDGFAPTLLAGRSPAQLAALMPLTVDGGITVQGQVTDASGPVSGARVVLRAGVLPSTAGMTGPTGGFVVRAAAGTYGMTVTRANQANNRSTEVIVPALPGIAVNAAAATMSLNVQMAAVDSTALALTVTGSDGGVVAAGTRMVVISTPPLAGQATLTVGTQQQAASIRVRAELSPKIDGTLSIPDLPRAHYSATLLPASATGSDAITTVADLDLTVDQAVAPTISLRRKVRLTGKLLPDPLAGDTPVTAIDLRGDFPIAIPGAADSAGAWLLMVNPDRQYTLRAQPKPGGMLARSIFGPVAVQGADLAVADQRLPPALLYSGTLVDHALQGLGGATIQVYCLTGLAGCADPDTPIAEAITRSDGHFDLFLPDPGVN